MLHGEVEVDGVERMLVDVLGGGREVMEGGECRGEECGREEVDERECGCDENKEKVNVERRSGWT